jgi:NADPH2:quinone reductase
MHAIRQHAFGPPETLRYEEVPDPVPAEGQVRIAVESAGVHLVDTTIRRGVAGGLTRSVSAVERRHGAVGNGLTPSGPGRGRFRRRVHLNGGSRQPV